jgi:hypothetical protein
MLTYLLKMDKNTQFSNFTLFSFPVHHSPCFVLFQLSPLRGSYRYLCLVLSFALRPVDPRADTAFPDIWSVLTRVPDQYDFSLKTISSIST